MPGGGNEGQGGHTLPSHPADRGAQSAKILREGKPHRRRDSGSGARSYNMFPLEVLGQHTSEFASERLLNFADAMLTGAVFRTNVPGVQREPAPVSGEGLPAISPGGQPFFHHHIYATVGRHENLPRDAAPARPGAVPGPRRAGRAARLLLRQALVSGGGCCAASSPPAPTSTRSAERTALYIAAECGHSEAVEALARRGGDVDCAAEPGAFDSTPV